MRISLLLPLLLASVSARDFPYPGGTPAPEPLRAELIAFIGAVRGEKSPAVTGEEGVASLQIATQCLQGQPAGVAPAFAKRPRRAAG